MWPDTFGAWAEQLRAEGAVHAAAFQAARNYGAALDRANELAEDAEQHCLGQAAQHIGTPGHFTSYEHFRNWVRRCAVNYIHDHFRRERRSRQLEDPDVTPTPQPAMDEETAASIRRCLENLNERDRALLTRYYLDGLTLDEMAKEVLPPDGRTANARRIAIHRQIQEARARFWQCLQNHGVDPRHWGCRD